MNTKLLRLIDKNFKIIARSKISSLIIIFGPLLVMFLAGYAFDNSSEFDLDIGYYEPEATNLSTRFIDALSDRFTLKNYTDESLCIDDVKNLITNGCLVFPQNFEVNDGQENLIQIYVDNSKVNIVDLIQNSLNEVIFVESSEISADLTKVLLTSINDVSSKLDRWRSTVNTDILSIQNEISTSVDSANTQLNGLDTSTGDASTIADDLSTNAAGLEDLLDDAEAITKSALDDLKDIKSDLESGNVSGASNVIANIEESIISINNDIKSLQNSSSTTGSALINAILDATTTLSDIESKLDETQKVKNDFTSRFADYKTKISQTKEKLTILAVEMEVTKVMLSNIRVRNTDNIVNPVTSQVNNVITNNSQLNYIFPSLMILVVMFVSLMLGATIVVIEKLSPSKFRLFTTPTSDFSFITSIFISVLIVAIYQIIILLLVAQFMFGIDVLTNIHNTIFILLLSAVIFNLIGMTIGYLFSNEQTTILGAISLGSAFILVSDLILPFESISPALQPFVQFTPFVLLSNLLRRTILFESSIFSFGIEIIVAILYFVILFALLVLVHKLVKVLFIFNHVKRKQPKK